MGLWSAVLVGLSAAERARLERVQPAAERVASETGIRPEMLLGVAWRESRWRPEAVNPDTGALGLMQIMPGNARRLGLLDTWRDPLRNIRAGARILREHGYGREPLLDVFRGYGGFRGDVEEPGGRDDPVPYRDEVLEMATRLSVRS